MSLFKEDLDQALDELDISNSHYDSISCYVKDILCLKDQIKEKEKELRSTIDRMCAELSTKIRAIQPSLIVSIKTNCCEIGYRTKNICCIIKPIDGCWDFESTEFGCIFSRRYPQCRQLLCSLDELSKCLVEFFNNAYRSLA